METKFDIEVTLVGQDGNAFNILGTVKRALRRAGATQEEQAAYIAEATAGDYNNLLAVTQEWVVVV